MAHDSNTPVKDASGGPPITPKSSSNGVVNFFNTPTAAARQAAADVQLFATALAGSQPSPFDVAPAVVAGIVGAVATAASAAATVASAAVSVAGLVKDSDGDPVKDAIEIEILNNTPQSVVPFSYVPTACDFTEVAQPLAPTAADSFLLTSGSVGTFGTTTSFTLSFLVGSSGNTIAVDLTLSYKSGIYWDATLEIDQETQPSPSSQGLQLTGAQFLGKTGFPSFSVYVTPVESPTGKITVAFYATQG